MPAPPAAIARVIQACSDPATSAQALGELVARDTVFTAELLRLVNSAFFCAKREVSTARQAVTLLGSRALRNLALCLAVRDAVRPGSLSNADLGMYWEDALRRAVACRLIARRRGFDGEEAFTFGLLQDFGMLALLVATPGLAARWPEWRRMGPDERRIAEHAHAGLSHDAVGLQLARAWQLPAGIALPMACHHDPDSSLVPVHHREACRIALAADYVAAVFSNHSPVHAVAQARQTLDKLFGLKGTDAEEVIASVPQAVEEAAQSLALRVESQPRYEEILSLANQGLMAANADYETLTQKLEQALEENRALVRKLEAAQKRLEELAFVDPLTGLLNRRKFHDAACAEVTRHSRGGAPLSFIMIDLDHFKRVNDTFGHAAGDDVLVAVASALQRTLRLADLKARLGGEELCCILPETDEEGALRAAERVRVAIEAIQVQTAKGPVPITASLGSCTWRGRPLTATAAELAVRGALDAADAALYDSKRSGRNRATHRHLQLEAGLDEPPKPMS